MIAFAVFNHCRWHPETAYPYAKFTEIDVGNAPVRLFKIEVPDELGVALYSMLDRDVCVDQAHNKGLTFSVGSNHYRQLRLVAGEDSSGRYATLITFDPVTETFGVEVSQRSGNRRKKKLGLPQYQDAVAHMYGFLTSRW